MQKMPYGSTTASSPGETSTRRSFNSGWTVRPKTSIFFELGGIAAPWTEVTLPHDAVIAQPREAAAGSHTGYYPGGVYEYRKEFEVPVGLEGRRVAFEFEGVYRDAMVFINDQYVGQRPSGYAGFVVEADAFLNIGARNSIRVEARAHEDSRWYTGAGIYRDVWMLATGDIYLDPNGVRVTTPDVDLERAVIMVATTVRNAGRTPRTVRVRTTIAADSNVVNEAPVTVMPGGEATVRQRLMVQDARLWSPDAPHLYNVTSEVVDEERVVDNRTTQLGIRTLQLDPLQGLRLNGETVKLRGACIHHDNGPLGAATFARAEERRVELLKAAGFNAIRSSHNPLSTAMLDACDRLGMLVIDETFDIWTESKSGFDYSLAFPEWWERDVEAMVLKDINHPSVIMYSIGNEIFETGNALGTRWGRAIAEKIRSIDQTRYVTNSINGLVSVIRDVSKLATGSAGGGVNAVMNDLQDVMNQVIASPLVSERTEESYAVVDVAGMNYGESRYQLDEKLFPDRIILGTETSPNQIAANWAAVLASPRLLGDFTWTGWEYLGEAGIGRVSYLDDVIPPMSGPFPWRVSGSGDLDITGRRRPVSYYREIVFGLRSAPYIAVQPPESVGRTRLPGKWSWTGSEATWDWSVEPGTPLVVEVYADADEVELLVGDRIVDRRPSGAAVGYRTEFAVGYSPAKLTAIAYRGGTEFERTELASPRGTRTLRATADRTRITTAIGELCFIDLAVVDSLGTVFASELDDITIEVDGPATLQALGNGRPDSDGAFESRTCELFQGRALAIVRPQSEGEVVVRATTSRGLSARVVVSVLPGEKH
jgi:beta-galactosidase